MISLKLTVFFIYNLSLIFQPLPRDTDKPSPVAFLQYAAPIQLRWQAYPFTEILLPRLARPLVWRAADGQRTQSLL